MSRGTVAFPSGATAPVRVAVPRTREFTILAQDPAIRVNRRILTACIEVPAEALAAGPWGHRVQVIDYDASTGIIYEPPDVSTLVAANGSYIDPYAKTANDDQLLGDPHFHAQNVYAIVMRTLAYFEKALGRRVGWGFRGHQLKVVPHAFADSNAFYSPKDEALVFGYFPDEHGTMIYTCLSHDIVAHEATHALVDGLRQRFTWPSSADQAGFHEGFADIVALLSVFSVKEILSSQLGASNGTVLKRDVEVAALRDSTLFGLAEQMGRALSRSRWNALRRATYLKPSTKWLEDDDYREPHKRGEVLLAAVMNAFLVVWSNRVTTGLRVVVKDERDSGKDQLDKDRVVQEGVDIADYLLTMCIRALDYTPPVDLQLSDFLSAVLTADNEMRPDDRYGYRKYLLESFAAYGIAPASNNPDAPGCWNLGATKELLYTRTHFESMLRDPDEVYWFIWENRDSLGVFEDTYGHVLSVRPCVRVGPDGFSLRETVVEFLQVLTLTAGELTNIRDRKADDVRVVRKPVDMPDSQLVTLYGGNTLIFDEYGRLKFNIHNGISDADRQTERLRFLWEAGFFTEEGQQLQRFSNMHLRRALDLKVLKDRKEEWD